MKKIKQSDIPTVTKKELAEEAALKLDLPAQRTKEALQCFLDLATAHLNAGKRLEFRDFGVLYPATRIRSGGHNPKTGVKTTTQKTTRTVRWKAGRLLKHVEIKELP